MTKWMVTWVMLGLFLMLAACNGGNEASQGDDTSGANEDHQEPSEEEQDGSDADIDALLDQLTFDASASVDGGRVKFEMALSNDGDEALDLTFSSGQKFEVVVTNPETNEGVYRYSASQMFTEAIETMTIEAGETVEFSDTWLVSESASQVSDGTYEATIELVPTHVNDMELDGTPLSQTVQFDLTSANVEADENPLESEDNENSGASDEQTTGETDSFVRHFNVEGSDGTYSISGEVNAQSDTLQYYVEDGHYVLVNETLELEEVDGWQSFSMDVTIEEMPEYGAITLYLFETDESGNPSREFFETLETIE
ncbi:hypothetical protein ABID56_001493 [Alkalibacillus flavidus]|uniref:Intracellular proteinase inhibitor BsuPI domain-containing protein n=1 Tax=Alkalibacillus flavidus TaxID=546021 RepID=A0ABV2KUZ4_9BACI